MTPTPYEIASLAIILSKPKPISQLKRAYDLLVEADQLIKTRLADEERETAENLGRTLVPDLLGSPIKFDDVIEKQLIPKAVGKKGVDTSIKTKKGLIKALKKFFAACVPTSPLPENHSPEQRKQASHNWLTEIIEKDEIPRHLFKDFKRWRFSAKK
jgi:hypothetical protein